jgi:hypothetical protein
MQVRQQVPSEAFYTGKVDQLTTSAAGNFIKTWDSIQAAATALNPGRGVGGTITSINNVLQGSQTTAAGFKWRKHG